MKRRTLLVAASSIGLGGCLGSAAEPANDGTTGTPSPESTRDCARTTTGGDATGTGTAEPESTPDPDCTPGTTGTTTRDGLGSPFPRTVTAENVEDGPLRETFGVAAGVTVPDGEVTAGNAARVDVDLRTTGDAPREVTYEQRHCGRNGWRASAGGYGLFLLPAGGDWTAEDTECPVVDGRNLGCGIPVVEETVVVPASGTLTWRYVVLASPHNVDRGECVAPGRYGFDREFVDGSSSVTLSFDLVVVEP